MTASRVLVVTNEDLADANEVPEAIRPLIDQAEEIRVIAPTLTTLTTWLQWVATDIDGARVSADVRLRTVFEHMQAGGLQPSGTVGSEDQLSAITDALAEFDAELIVLRLHARGSAGENWREHRIAEQVRSRFDLPTAVFFFDADGQVVAEERA